MRTEHRRLATLLSAAALVLVTVPGGARAASETHTGSVDASATFWRGHDVSVTASGQISIALGWDDASADLNLFLKDPTGATVASATTSSRPEQLSYEATTTGTYRIGIKALSGAATYTATVSHSPGGADHAGTVDASGTAWRSHAEEVPEPTQLTITLDWTATDADLNLFLKDPSGSMVAMSTSGQRPESMAYQATLTGTYRIGVKAVSGASGYAVTVDHAPVAVSAPQHVSTVGFPGSAEMYPSGTDIGADDRLYVADTGNDRVAAYRLDGARVWAVGERGTRDPGAFSNPRDVAEHGGRIYVADTDHSRIQVLDAADGRALAIWPHRFGAIMGISTGVDGSHAPIVLAADGSTSTIRVFDLAGNAVRTVGSGWGSGPGQLKEPRDAATGPDGTIYVADFKNHRVGVFSPSGVWLGSWGTHGAEPGQFKEPYGIDVDVLGNVYVADSNNDRIQAFRADGTYLRSYGTSGDVPGTFSMLRNVAVGNGSAPGVFGADLWGRRIEQFSHDGTHVRTFGGDAPPDGGLNEPYGVAITPDLTYVADMVNQRIQAYRSDGSFAFAFGSRGWWGDLDGMNWPRDIAVTADGNVWVADTKNFRLTEFTSTGTPTGRTLGSRGSETGQLNWPYAIAAAGDHLIVADTWNSRVERWDPSQPESPVVWTATDLSFPKDVSVHGNEVYVADSLNHRIVVLSASTGARARVLGTGSELHHVEGVAVEPDGTVWASDTAWNRLVEFSPTGEFRRTFGRKGSAVGEFNAPAHLEVAVRDGRTLLYVVDQFNGRIQILRVG